MPQTLPHEKDAHVEVLTPQELLNEDVDASLMVALHRYELEVARINTFMREQMLPRRARDCPLRRLANRDIRRLLFG